MPENQNFSPRLSLPTPPSAGAHKPLGREQRDRSTPTASALPAPDPCTELLRLPPPCWPARSPAMQRRPTSPPATTTCRCAGTTPFGSTTRSGSSRATPRSAIRRSPTRATTASTTATRSPSGSTCCPSSISSTRRNSADASAPPRGTTPPTTRPATRTRIRRWSTSRATSTTSTARRPTASTKARRASCSTRSCSAASTSATFPCRPSSVATRCTGASRCSSAATCTASRMRKSRSICRRGSPLPAPKPRSCSGR